MRSKEELIAWLKGEIEHYGERLLYEDIIKHLSQPEPTSGQYDDLIEFMGAMYGYVPDGYEEEYNQVVEALRQANEPRFEEELKEFNVLKHLREGGKVTRNNLDGYMYFDGYLVKQKTNSGDILHVGQTALLQCGDWQPYKEPEPKLDDGKWYWCECMCTGNIAPLQWRDGKNLAVTGWVNAHEWCGVNGGAYKAILDENGNPKECK